jgi:hypothetical protein
MDPRASLSILADRKVSVSASNQFLVIQHTEKLPIKSFIGEQQICPLN